jgi:prephenate dehydrogenase
MSQRKTLCVVGLGLIGGSIAASVKTRGAPLRVVAADRRRSSLSYALQRGFIDEAAESFEAGVAAADVVILAVPVRSIHELLRGLSGSFRPGQVVTDVGSAKVSILETAREALPKGVAFVGGHPVAGAERSGIASALPGLFEGRTCVLTPARDTDREALESVTELWRTLGSEVIYLSPEKHDRIFALVSHLPHAVAYSLMNAVAGELPVSEMGLAGTSLRDFTRVIRSAPELWRDIFLENRPAVLEAIDVFASRLEELRGAISNRDEAAMVGFFERAADVKGIRWTP